MPNDLTLPSLGGDVAYTVKDSLRKIVTAINSLLSTTEALSARIHQPLTLDQIRKALSATGATPLNIFQLIGAGSDTGVIQVGTHAQRLLVSAVTAPQGLLFWETDRTALYVVDVQKWKLIVNEPMAVTLSPNTKPTDLTVNDVNFLIRSTDFDRLYRWTGAAWIDAAGQPQRGSIEDFPITLGADFTPGAGWHLCDGTANVVYSKSDGTTGTVTVPDLTTLNRFRRAVAGATGGTGGSATTHTHPVDPPSTSSGGPSAVTEVDNNLDINTTFVGNDTHHHDTDINSFNTGTPSGTGGDDALPPYMNFRPYMRL